MSERPSGTANILHQHSEYEKLEQDYSAETANELTAKSLKRHGVDAAPNEVSSWHKINKAAVDGKMDIPGERKVAETLADGAAAGVIAAARVSAIDQTPEALQATAEFEDEDSEEEGAAEEDELPTIDEMYGFDDPEDNAEAALDDVLKAQERSD
ncbi:hypothetical protein [Burkholderia ubonensis]|uniref:hypothetical protein n=1 Tax=Burkholderia ubonensis TaxID=101571 RepID=UPI00075C9CCF|nr:hypothetical protein [Burkholderia ubonensis]